MGSFPFYLISGICFGAIIALIAVGYSLVYGIIKLINFAHGEFFMVGAYAGLLYYEQLPSGLPHWLTIPLVLLVSGLAGAAVAGLTELVAYRPIRNAGRLAALLTAIGASFLLQSLFCFVRQAQPQHYGDPLGSACQTTVKIGDEGFYVIRLAYIGVTAALAVWLWHIVMRTKFGRAMRAISQDQTAAVLMGVNVNSVIQRTFLLGGFLAGIAGTLVALPGTVTPTMGFVPGLKAFAAAVVGGIGSIPGAVLGGFLIGITEYMIVWAGVPTNFKDVAAFVVLILVLVVRPQGILGKPEREKV